MSEKMSDRRSHTRGKERKYIFIYHCFNLLNDVSCNTFTFVCMLIPSCFPNTSTTKCSGHAHHRRRHNSVCACECLHIFVTNFTG